MRLVPFLLSSAATIGLVTALHSRIGSLPPVGPLLSPAHGLWRNAEPAGEDFSLELQTPQLKDAVNVFLDERLVPHVFAQNDHDAYFVQGYLHARFRLWQMEFQTHAAAGRLSEIFGEKVGNNSVVDRHDRLFRRLGMVYAAENALKAFKQDPAVMAGVEAYTAGVNYYISQLHPNDYPIEYKLLDYAPEPWTPLKTALFLKYMSYDLARDLDDFEYTNLRDHLGASGMEQAFPIMADSVDPIAPRGSRFMPTRPKPAAPAMADSVYISPSLAATVAGFTRQLPERDPDVGSNNWVIGGQRTGSGRPILCNDPHLGLNLPSLWYEIQLHTPEYNVYGVSFPGAPGVVIGFNDSIAWGVTNSSRDVMDFYEVQFRDSTMNEYLYNGEWVKTEWRNEVIRIRDKADLSDKVAMTVWGPVAFDSRYANDRGDGKAYAVRWSAHDPSNEMLTFWKLNRAKNYEDYYDAIGHFNCPGQNFVFASKSNDIAWWQQANFPAKWRRQGDYVMPGHDSSYAWQGMIPREENVHMINPERGFVSSANQLPADTTYPYYLGGVHDVYRGIIINRYLHGMQGVGVEEMKRMQTDNYNVFAEIAVPVLLRHTLSEQLTPQARRLLDQVKAWNLRADADSEGMSIFYEWWNTFRRNVWNDELKRPDSLPTPFPQDNTLIEALIRDTSFAFIDDKRTETVETLTQQVTKSLNEAAGNLAGKPLAWAAYKATSVRHLLPTLTPFHRGNLPIGGGAKIINATTATNGPSWRMVVHMSDDVEAYGVYPGGQHGNPGSRYYDQFVDQWARGEYNPLWVMKHAGDRPDRVRWTMRFRKSAG